MSRSVAEAAEAAGHDVTTELLLRERSRTSRLQAELAQAERSCRDLDRELVRARREIAALKSRPA